MNRLLRYRKLSQYHLRVAILPRCSRARRPPPAGPRSRSALLPPPPSAGPEGPAFGAGLRCLRSEVFAVGRGRRTPARKARWVRLAPCVSRRDAPGACRRHRMSPSVRTFRDIRCRRHEPVVSSRRDTLGASRTQRAFLARVLRPALRQRPGSEGTRSLRRRRPAATGALVVVEEAQSASVILPAGFSELERREYGDTQVVLGKFR